MQHTRISKKRWVVSALALALVTASCTTDDADTESTDAPEVSEAPDVTTADTDPPPTEPPDDEPVATTAGTDPPATDPPDTDPPDDTSTGDVVGVTDDSIKIAYIGFDTEVLVALGIVEETAELPVVAQAIVDDINARGGVHGRTIELVPEIWSPLKPDLPAELQRACLAVTEDAQVFAATAVSFFGDAVNCLVTDHNTPLIAQGIMPGATMYSGNQNTFTLSFEEGRGVTSSVAQLGAQGHLDDLTRLAAFGDDDIGRKELMDDVLAGALDGVGRTLDDTGLVPPNLQGSGAETAAIITRFKEDGVDGVFLLGNLLSNAGFMVEAEKQGYNPRYLMSDFGDGTSDLLITRAPASQLDGSVGTTWRRTGQDAAGAAPSEYDLSCYERFGGEVILDDVRQDTVIGAVAEQCVTFDLLEAALTGAGPDLTREGFVAALEALGTFEMGIEPTGSFGEGKHDAVDAIKTVQWQTECECWFPIAGYEPIG